MTTRKPSASNPRRRPRATGEGSTPEWSGLCPAISPSNLAPRASWPCELRKHPADTGHYNHNVGVWYS